MKKNRRSRFKMWNVSILHQDGSDFTITVIADSKRSAMDDIEVRYYLRKDGFEVKDVVLR